MAKQAIIILAVVLVFGVLVPRYKGLDFIDPVIIVVYACISLPFVVPASAGLAPDSRLDLLSKMAVILAYGWITSILILISSLITVNITHWNGSMRIPPAGLIASAALLGLTAAVAVISGTALLSRRLGARGAKNILRTGFLGVLLLWAFGFRYLPPEWRTALARQLTTEGLERFCLLVSALCALAATVMVPRLIRGVEPDSPPG
jgi:hypothetical protein